VADAAAWKQLGVRGMRRKEPKGRSGEKKLLHDIFPSLRQAD
jgi:hypothetical protein